MARGDFASFPIFQEVGHQRNRLGSRVLGVSAASRRKSGLALLAGLLCELPETRPITLQSMSVNHGLAAETRSLRVLRRIEVLIETNDFQRQALGLEIAAQLVQFFQRRVIDQDRF